MNSNAERKLVKKAFRENAPPPTSVLEGEVALSVVATEALAGLRAAG
jgi:hypothetical protein